MAKTDKITQKYGNQAAKRLTDEVKKANKTATAKREIAKIKEQIKNAAQSTTVVDFQL